MLLAVRKGDGNDVEMKVACKKLCQMLLKKAMEMCPSVQLGQKKDAWPIRKAAFLVGLKATMVFKLLNDRGVFAVPPRDMDLMDLDMDDNVEKLLFEFGCSEKEVLAVKMKKMHAWLTFLKGKCKRNGTFGGSSGSDGEIWYEMPWILDILGSEGFEFQSVVETKVFHFGERHVSYHVEHVCEIGGLHRFSWFVSQA